MLNEANINVKKPGSLWTLAGLLVLGGLLSYLWVTLVLPPFNSEHLGSDACHHAIMIHALSVPDATEGAFMAGPYASYPHLSHQLAAWLMPLVAHDAFKAMRLVGVMCLLGLLATQYHLFRRVFSPPAALLILLAWQYLGCLTRTADTWFFLDAYFFAQAVGEWFLWLAIACISWPARSRWGKATCVGVSIGLAAAAYLCHLVPGFIALGGVGLVLLLRLVDRPRWPTVAAMGVLAAVGLTVIFGSEQLAHMQGCKNQDGATPFKRIPLILLWIPTACIALTFMLRRTIMRQITPLSPKGRGGKETPRVPR